MGVVIAAYLWHSNAVDNAISVATINTRNAVVLEYTKKSTELQQKADLAQITLEQKIERITDDKNKQLSSVNAKYSDLLKWVQSQPNGGSTGNKSSISNGSTNPESTSGTNRQGLLRGNEGNSTEVTSEVILDGPIKDLVDYARSTEELKVHLLSCYKQYDQVLEDQRKFKLQTIQK